MNWEQYETASSRTAKSFEDGLVLDQTIADVLHGTAGLVTESSELMDALKKNFAYGKELDIVNVSEELGDLMWYVALITRTLNLNLEDIMQQNIDKLKLRYPDKFTNEAALNRNLDVERDHLEQTTVQHQQV